MSSVGICKFGSVLNIDILDAPLDLWNGGSMYPFPAAAAVTTVVSDDVADDGSPEGTGAHTAQVFGLDANYRIVRENVILNGTSPVTLTTEFLRVYRIMVLTAGDDGTNKGRLSVLHGATSLAEVTPLIGQTLMAVYTVPAGPPAKLVRWWVTSTRKEKEATILFRTRAMGGAWQTKHQISLFGNGVIQNYPFPDFVTIDEKTDVVIHVLSVTGDGTSVFGGFDLVHQSR